MTQRIQKINPRILEAILQKIAYWLEDYFEDFNKLFRLSLMTAAVFPALEPLWPFEAILLYHWLAPISCRVTDLTTRFQGSKKSGHARWSVHCTEELSQMCRTIYLDQRPELVDFKASFLLGVVAHIIWEFGMRVANLERIFLYW